VYELLPDLQEAGFDILNPVQISAASMNPETLKREFGSRFTFWGGGINTQQTFPFKSPEEVKEEVRSLVKTWKTGGGFVFAAVHNIQAGIPTANLRALWEAFQESRQYP
jgi:uroporphyrinogen decarboxylase